MAITQAGSMQSFDGPFANSGTVTATMTVPADAEIAVVGWSGYSTTANYFTGGSMTLTKGGVDTAMTVAVTGANSADNNTGVWMGAVFYLVAPDTGTNKSLKFDWVGAGNPSDGDGMCSITFWKGIDTASPVRSALGAQASAVPVTTGTLTCLTGDLIVAFAACYASSPTVDGTADSWSNLTTLTQIPQQAHADGAWATGSPSGNTTVALSTETGFDDVTITAVVLKPAASTFTWLEMFWSSLIMPLKHRVREMVGY